jgi:hypothetical protein
VHSSRHRLGGRRPRRHRYDGNPARTCEPPLTAIDLHLPVTAAAAVKLLQMTSGGDAPVSVVKGQADLNAGGRET